MRKLSFPSVNLFLQKPGSGSSPTAKKNPEVSFRVPRQTNAAWRGPDSGRRRRTTIGRAAEAEHREENDAQKNQPQRISDILAERLGYRPLFVVALLMAFVALLIALRFLRNSSTVQTTAGENG